MPTTPNLGLPYPVGSAACDVPADTQALAEAVDNLYARLLFQPGDLKVTAAQTPTTGWLLCDGTAVSRTVYPALFAAIGTSFGAGDGSTTFNLPDLRGRVPQGAPAPASLGAKGGESTHTLSVAEMPAHAHSVYDPGHAHSISDPGHVHAPAAGSTVFLYAGGGVTNAGFQNLANQTGKNFTQTGAAGTGIGVASRGTGISLYNNGSGAAANNLPPFQNVNYFVKT